MKYAKVPVEALLDPRLKPRDLRVLIALLSFADNGGNCYPKRKKLSDLTGLNQAEVSRVTTRLVRFGWIEKEGHGGHGRPCQYKLNEAPANGVISDTVERCHHRHPKTEERCHVRQENGVISDTGKEQTIEQTNKTPVVPLSDSEKNQDPQSELETPFDQFWKTYPSQRRDSKKKCLAKWQKEKLDKQADAIMADLAYRKAHCANWQEGSDYAFVPLTTTYLNQAYWINKPKVMKPMTAVRYDPYAAMAAESKTRKASGEPSRGLYVH